MSRFVTRLLAALRVVGRRNTAERELDEEMQYHLEREIQGRVSAGLTPEQARVAALRAMGAIDSNKEACRDLCTGHRMSRFAGGVLQDLRFAVRLVRRQPAPVGIAIGGLALAIGVVTSVFSIVNASLLRPYGMDDPSSVVSVARPGLPAWVGWPYARFLQMRDGATLSRVEASLQETVRVSTASADDIGSPRPILFVTGGYLSLLGGRPIFGRAIGPSDDVPNAPGVVVVSHAFWKAELNGDPSVVGGTLWVNGVPVTLVGVLDPDFTGPIENRRSVWATLAALDDLRMGSAFTETTREAVEVVARLAPGVAMRAAQENLTAIVRGSSETGPTPSGRVASQGVVLYSAASPIAGRAESDVYVGLACVFGVAGLVLALACANMANLLLAAAVTRIREVGIRLAMGATRGRLIRQMVTESSLLGLMSGGVGFLLAIWMVPIFGSIVAMSPEIDLAPDRRVLLFTIGVALLCGLGAGHVPARFGARGHVLTALRSQTTSGGRAVMLWRFRSSFVGFQAAVSMLLLVVAALLVRTAMVAMHVEIGYDAERILAVSLDAPRSEFDEPAYIQAALAAVTDLRGVQRASVTQYQPFGPSRELDRFAHGGKSYTVIVNRSDADLFSTAGLRILRGRGFTTDEVSGEAPVALISDSLARAFFPGGDPIGRSLSDVPSAGRPEERAVVIGVVADALLADLDSEAYGAIYRPLSRTRSNIPSLIVRTATPALAARSVQDALRRIDTRVRPTTHVVHDRIDRFLVVKRQFAWVLGPTALLALVLSAVESTVSRHLPRASARTR